MIADEDAMEAPPISSKSEARSADDDRAEALAVTGSNLQITKGEWEAMEEVPQAVRRVGALFQVSAQELLGTAAASSLRRTTSAVSNVSSTGTSGFDEEAWSTLTGTKAPQASKNAGRKVDQLRRKRLEESLKADKARLADEVAEDKMPRLERYGNRFESFLAAALAWLERKKRPKVLAATTAVRLHQAALQRFAELPDHVAQRLTALAAGAGGEPLAALRELCEHEEHLAGAPLLDVDLALHSDQREFVAALLTACHSDAPLLLRYQTPPSGGKTSTVALLGACLQGQQRRHIIYACYSRQVRVDVGKHCLATCTPFAVVVQGIASPHNSCYHGRPPKQKEPPPIEAAKRVQWTLKLCRGCDRFPTVLICDLPSALLLLQQGCDYVLLFDEPTADVAPGMQADVRRLLRCCPAITALMSAGVPDFTAMPSFVEHYQRRHAGRLQTVACDRLPMSVTALDAQERVWAPHHLGVEAETIAADGHLLRFYSPRVLLTLVEAGAELAFEDLLSYGAVRAACLRALRVGTAAVEPPSSDAPALKLEDFCSKGAWRLPGASLVILDDVGQFLEAALPPNLANVPSLRRLLKAEGQLQKVAERSQELETRRAEASSKKLSKEDREARREELPRSQTWAGGGEPAELWPTVCVVNSLEHLTKHAPTNAKAFPSKWLRAALPLPSLVRQTTAETVIEAALCGVLPFGGLGDAQYEAAAQTVAEQARESFVVADVQLIYGLNLPFERVVVACRPLHYLDMKQLVGRAGRTGRLAKAEALFLDAATLRAAMVPPTDASMLEASAANFAV